MDHHAVRVFRIGNYGLGIDCACGQELRCEVRQIDAVDAFTAHVIGEMVVTEAMRRRASRAVVEQAKGAFRERHRWF